MGRSVERGGKGITKERRILKLWLQVCLVGSRSMS